MADTSILRGTGPGDDGDASTPSTGSPLDMLFIAKHEFRAQQQRQLSFPRKALLRIIARRNNGWWMGELLANPEGPVQVHILFIVLRAVS